MKSVRYHTFGGPSVLAVEEVERPRPGPSEVLVEIEAAGVNPTDTYYRAGLIDESFGELAPPQLPATPGSDFAGTVTEVGDRIRGFQKGDRVFGTGMHTGRTSHGTCAEFAAVPEALLAPLPENVDFVTGGAVGLAGVTAWRALVGLAGVAPGETCLVHGGSGGVGHIAVQIATAAGADVIATAGRQGARRRVAELGADTVLDYRADDLEREIIAAAPEGCDVILDHRLDDYASLDVEVAAFGGRVVNIGGTEGLLAAAPLARAKELTAYFMTIANLVERPGLPRVAAVLEPLRELLASDRLTVDVAREYSLEGVGEAHRALEEERFTGKLVVVP